MSSEVCSLARSLRQALASFSVEGLSGAQCAEMAEVLSATEKACGAAHLLAAARAVACGAHRQEGIANGAVWVARQAGTTTAQARQALATAGGLEGCPSTRAALLGGELSVAQAAEITRTQAEAPGTEATLLALARRGDLSALRDRARRERQGRLDVADLHRRQRAARRLRHWRDELGMVCLSAALCPEDGVGLVHRLERAAERGRRRARQHGTTPEPFEAHAADALVALCAGTPTGGRERAELVVVCDLFAWRRGHAHPGEPCQLQDGGPLPVEVAKDLAKDAFVKAVVHDGVAIHTVTHLGRHLPAELRTALELGPVPAFSGARCADCARAYGLEWDHVDPLAHTGPTSYANLQARCWVDHRIKTERDRKAGLLGRGAGRARNRTGSSGGRPTRKEARAEPGADRAGNGDHPARRSDHPAGPAPAHGPGAPPAARPVPASGASPGTTPAPGHRPLPATAPEGGAGDAPVRLDGRVDTGTEPRAGP